jgi:hypothetical protein
LALVSSDWVFNGEVEGEPTMHARGVS